MTRTFLLTTNQCTHVYKNRRATSMTTTKTPKRPRRSFLSLPFCRRTLAANLYRTCLSTPLLPSHLVHFFLLVLKSYCFIFIIVYFVDRGPTTPTAIHPEVMVPRSHRWVYFVFFLQTKALVNLPITSFTGYMNAF